MEEINALQLGGMDWNTIFRIPEEVELSCYDYFVEEPAKPYDIVFLNKTPFREEMKPLMAATKAYTLFVTENVEMTEDMLHFMKYKAGKVIKSSEIQPFFDKQIKDFFPDWYGKRYASDCISISRNFTGSVKWNGNHDVELQGQFGSDFCQLAFWKNTNLFVNGETQDFWLEYEKKDEVELQLKICLFQRADSSGKILKEWIIPENEFMNIVQLENTYGDGYLFVSLDAKGKGELKIVGLHVRKSRRDKGYFIPGGERMVTSQREEVFFYFDPGDMKPPLNVYFSGYKTKEGFEGYHMMRKMGSPFLLIAETRLEGGSFYMGSEEYETMIYHAIEGYMQKLGLTSDQVIMSGLSMGTFGAMYYGCDIRPHALIIGKPLASIGNVAGNETLKRPGGFPTSLDVLMSLYGNTDDKAKEELNRRFWDKFDNTNWNDTKFVVSYMIEDDYDGTAYQDLISNLTNPGAQIYGKGIHGRHNDNTYAIVKWFQNQYRKILEEDFSRKVDE